jgi:hypothetical protein
MVRGLRKKWKQPVAYYFTRGSTKAEMLTDFLEEVIDACQNAGLEVVATVCDTGSNIVKALKQLGVSEEEPFIKFHNKEIAAVFDPPHLKCTRNLFRTYDVQMNSEPLGNQLAIIAKWEHVLNLYKFDKPH